MAKGKKTGGRLKGSRNKIARPLKESILEAAEAAGGKEGTVGYLTKCAHDVPGPFLTLLGKVLPSEIVAAVATSNLTKEQRDAIAAAFIRADN